MPDQPDERPRTEILFRFTEDSLHQMEDAELRGFEAKLEDLLSLAREELEQRRLEGRGDTSPF